MFNANLFNDTTILAFVLMKRKILEVFIIQKALNFRRWIIVALNRCSTFEFTGVEYHVAEP
jgi:hypothetical protein